MKAVKLADHHDRRSPAPVIVESSDMLHALMSYTNIFSGRHSLFSSRLNNPTKVSPAYSLTLSSSPGGHTAPDGSGLPLSAIFSNPAPTVTAGRSSNTRSTGRIASWSRPVSDSSCSRLIVSPVRIVRLRDRVYDDEGCHRDEAYGHNHLDPTGNAAAHRVKNPTERIYG